MLGRLILIEQKLIGIDSSTFQTLCDLYLNLREHGISSFNRVGSQFGKQKTIKGTPDTFFRTDSGKLRYVEFTTKSDNVVKKLKEDIDKCLDSKLTKIPKKDISKILLLFNARLTTDQEKDVFQYAKDKRIFIELIGLDKLALDIYSEYPILSKDILGIPLETGQILPISNFIEEYNNKGGNLSTPLDNVFLNRKVELQNAKQILQEKDLFIISGSAGVGKTKLAIEIIREFIIENADYTAFVIAKKDVDIWEDLRVKLRHDKNYILLIDDANRQISNLEQILGIFKENRKGKLKLIITVRNYAYDDLSKHCNQFDTVSIFLDKFTDDEIKELIGSNSFKIRNPQYQNKILALSDGNARLAIMASKLALEKQFEFLSGGVYNLYDIYFQTFIKDFDLFKNTILLKTIGIISFFFTIERDNKELIEKLLNDFDLNYSDFQEAIEELHNRELVEVKDSFVRISEQVMSTYFFYKVFIKDKILSFNKLLFEYFDKYDNRFKETVIHSNNTFGYFEVLDKIKPDIDSYFEINLSNEERISKFIKLFWFYKREETLSYIYNIIKTEEEELNPKYVSTYENNDFSFEKDKILPFLTPFFRSYTQDSFIPALELAFEHGRKIPIAFTELIRRLKENISFDDDDEYSNNFEKQNKFIDLLISKTKEGLPHYTEAFLGLASNFLQHYNRVFKSGRKGHSFIHYNYPIPLNNKVKSIRIKIWIQIFKLYSYYPERILNVITDYKPHYGDLNIKILNSDLEFILPFIEDKLDRSDFRNIYFVHEFINWLDREQLEDRNYRNLKNLFHSQEFDDFKIFDWNYFSGKADYDYKNISDFERLKSKDICKHFDFSSSKDFSKFSNVIDNTLKILKNDYQIQAPINVILESNFEKDKEIGFKLFLHFLDNFSKQFLVIPYRSMSLIINDKDYYIKLWEYLKNWDSGNALLYKMTFFEILPNKFIEEKITAELFELVKNINSKSFISFDMLSKFEKIKSNISLEVLEIILEKKKNGISIFIDHDFFKEFTNNLSKRIDLIEELYLYEYVNNRNHFDYKREGLKEILKIDKDFIFKYIEFFYDKNGHRSIGYEDELGFVWSLYNDFEVENIFNSLIENRFFFGIGEEGIDMFFKNILEEEKERAIKFLEFYIVKYCKDSDKVNSVISSVRHYFSNEFEKFLLLYLEHNSNVEDFAKIWWRGNGGTVVGDVNLGEIEKSDWQRIYKMLENGKNQLELIPIKSRVRKEIDWAIKDAERERLRKFLNPNW